MRIAVISPHADDWAFSVAEHMLSRRDTSNFVIFCPLMGVPSDPAGEQKHITLLSEHINATANARAERVNGSFLDDVYGPQVISDLVVWFRQHELHTYDEVWLPLGIHHPDHVAIAEASTLAAGHDQSLCWYEELPYRVLYPELAVAARERVADVVHGYGSYYQGEQRLEIKKNLCRMYASQLQSDIERMLYVPERLWGVS